MQINKKFFSFLILSSLLLFSNSTGFDLYAHSVFYYFYNLPALESYLLLNEIFLPRYFFLSIIYELSSKLGLPLGWVALFLVLFPIYYIFCSSFFLSKKRSPTIEFFFFIFLIYLIFFYAALHLAIIWFLAYIFSKKKIFLLGGLFHPAAFFLYLFVLVITRRIKGLFFFIIIFFIPFLYLMYISSKYNIFTYVSYSNFKEISLSNAKDMLIYTFEAKLNSFIYIGIIFFFIIFFKKMINNFLFLSKFNLKIFFFVPYLVSILIIIYMFQKPTFLNYFFSKENLSIYVTWLKFGKSNSEFTLNELYCSRYYSYKEIPDICNVEQKNY